MMNWRGAVVVLLVAIVALAAIIAISATKKSGELSRQSFPSADVVHAPTRAESTRRTNDETTPASLVEPCVAIREDGSVIADDLPDPRHLAGRMHDIYLVGEGHQFVMQPNSRGEFAPPVELNCGEFNLTALTRGTPFEMLECVRSVTPRDLTRGGKFEFRRPSTALVRVRCEDDTGRGLKASVKVDRKFGTGRMSIGVIATDSAGDGSVVAPGDGEYYGSLEAVESRSVRPFSIEHRTITVASGAGILTFVVPRPASLQVRVLGPNEAPIAGAGVNLVFADGGVFRSSPNSGETGPNGEFSFVGVPPGAAILQITGPQYEPHVERLALVSGVPQSRTVRMDRGGHVVRGQITNIPTEVHWKTGQGVHVVHRGTIPEDVMAIWGVRVEPDGRFEAAGLPAGECEIHISPGNLFVLTDVVSPEVDLGVLDCGVAFERGDRAALVRVDLSDPLFRNVWINYRRSDWPRWLWRTFGARVDVRASFSGEMLENCTPGRYEFELSNASLDPSAFDLRRPTVVDLTGTSDAPTAVALVAPRR